MALIASDQAHAANTLLELFQQRRQKQAEVAPTPAPAPVKKPATSPERAKPVAATTAPANPDALARRAKVQAPQVYDYKPEKLVRIDFNAVDPQRPSATDALTEGMSAIGVDEPAIGAGQKSFNEAEDYLKETQVYAEKAIADAIVSYYTNKRHFIWVADDQALDKAKSLVGFFASADEDGLNPEEYAVTIPSETYGVMDREARLRKLAEFEILLSARALRYALDAGEGRIIANRLSGFHDLPRGRIDLLDVLNRLAETADPAAVLYSYQPQNEQYRALKRALAEMAPDSDETIRIALDGVIRPGDRSEHLAKIVTLITRHAPASYLAKHGDVLRAHADAQIYSPELVSAIKSYQKLSSSAPDGIIGKATLASLHGEQSSIKRDRILYAMERLRWLPHDFGNRYVFVNQPAFRAEYFEDGRLKLGMNVVIGSPTNQTYFFYNKVQMVVFNPSWGVPRSIVVNEMLPRIMRDRSYLDRNGYEVYQNGKKVSANAVNWSAVAAGKAHVGIRQKPSLDNALGELKILFPNAHDIYMHDTPAKSYFARDMRALSHGCIRLERPREMAAAVMGTKVAELNKYFGGNERGIKVKEPVPIYIAYFTAWPDENGTIHYYGDVYNRDSALQKAFEKTAASRLAAI